MNRFRHFFAATALLLAGLCTLAEAPAVFAEGFVVQHHRMMAPCRTVLPLDATHLAVGRGPLLVILDVADAANPRVVSETPLSGTILDMARNGNVLLAAAGQSGLRVVDISNFLAPKEVSIYNKGFTNAVAVHPNGKMAYIAVADSTVIVVKVEDPYHPKGVNQFGFQNAFFQDLLCTGSILLAAAGPKGVYVYNLEIPSEPVKVSRFKDLESANFLALDGRLLAVGGIDANGLMGVALVNYSTWGEPVQKGFLDVGSQVLDLARVPSNPSTALLALGDEGYAVADLSDPTAPTIVFSSKTTLPVTAADPAISGPTAFLSCAYNGLWRADFGLDPEPVLNKLMEANVVARTLTSKGNVVFMSTEERNLEVWDYTEPLLPEFVTVIQTPRTAQHLLVKGDLLVASCEADGFSIYDISSPLSPVFLSSTNPHGTGNGSTVSSDIWGNLLAIGDTTDGLRLFDITDPTLPVAVLNGTWNAKTGYVRGVYFQDADSVWCAQSTRGLVALQVNSAGTSPTEVGNANLTDTVTGQFAVLGTHAYASTQSGCEIIDISTPAKPDNMKTLGASQAYFSGIFGEKLYVARGISGLEEWDISGTPQCFQTRLFNTPGLASALTRTENGAFALVDGEGGAWTFSVSDCPGPVLRLPCDGQVVPFQNITLFTWDKGSASKFRVDISRDPGFSKGDKTISSGQTETDHLNVPYWIPSAEKWKKLLKWGRGNMLYWRVQLFDEKGNKLGTSEVRTFGL